jgi:polyisoprenoid-binding protein YceI
MLSKRIGTVAAAVAAVIAFGGFAAAQRTLNFTPESKIWIDGTSTVRSFTCQAGVPAGTAQLAGPVASLAEIGAAARSARFTIKVAAMNCNDNGTMNDHMRKALKADAAPEITFTMKSVKAETAEGDSWEATIAGDLTMAGATRPVEVKATATLFPDGAIRLRGTAPLNMKDWGIKPPSLLLGTMKVGVEVMIGFDLVLGEVGG